MTTEADMMNLFLRETPAAFADYARLCYRELGAYVKMWITLNEPNDETVSYQEAHQMLRAHAMAWHAYDQEFRHAQGGQVCRRANISIIKMLNEYICCLCSFILSGQFSYLNCFNRIFCWTNRITSVCFCCLCYFCSLPTNRSLWCLRCVLSQVSLALHMDWVEPAFSFSREDVEPAKRVLDFRVGWFAEPIFGRGDYPVGMRSWLRQLNSLEYNALFTVVLCKLSFIKLINRLLIIIITLLFILFFISPACLCSMKRTDN